MEQIWSISLSQMVPSTSFCVKSCPCHLEELQYLSQGRPKIWCWSVQTYLLSSMQLFSPSLKETFFCSVIVLSSFPDRSAGKKKKNLPAMQEIEEKQFQSLGQEDPLEVEMTTHFSILVWEIPWSEEPGGL